MTLKSKEPVTFGLAVILAGEYFRKDLGLQLAGRINYKFSLVNFGDRLQLDGERTPEPPLGGGVLTASSRNTLAGGIN